MQILARVRCNLADRSPLNHPVEIEHRKIAHLESALRNIYEIGRLLAQTFQGGINLLFRNLRVRQLHRNVLVFRQLELRRGHHRRTKPHRFVLAELHVFDIAQRSYTQLLLRDRVVITFRDKFLCHFVLDFLAKSFFDDRARRFAGSITGNLGKTGEAVGDRVPFLGDFFRRQLDPQGRD